nr:MULTISPECIES: hypothetical protein [unclassified Rhodococcus (in: high G+C Gram-positive bacteria)]
MNAVNDHATGDVRTPVRLPGASSGSVADPATDRPRDSVRPKIAIHPAANTTGIDHSPRTIRQPPSKASAKGTDTPDATPALALITAVNSPVNNPSRRPAAASGSPVELHSRTTRRTKTGPNTFATAIPAAATRVPTTRIGHDGTARTAVPTATRDRHTTRTCVTGTRRTK